jgi:FKBP-type peptidyl-prolyl cis-trans isomerase
MCIIQDITQYLAHLHLYPFTVHYEGTLAENGEVFDTTHEDNSIFSFEIGQGAVIKAWDIALRTMKV